MGTHTQLTQSGERIRLESGGELYLDDRPLGPGPGWRLRPADGAADEPVDLRDAFLLCGPPLARHVTSLTVALICELHTRAEEGDDDARTAKYRLTRQLAESVHRLARASDA
jgi:hypothetical protein